MDIYLLNQIGLGSSTAEIIKDQLLNGNGEDVDVYIDSPGGSVTQGISIANMLKMYPGRVTTNIIGSAYSMASIIAMVGDEVNMADGGLFMIHNPSMSSGGTADQLKTMAGTLEGLEETMIGIYSARSGQSPEAIKNFMDNETFFTANEAKEAGFIDNVTKQLQAVAIFNSNTNEMSLKDDLKTFVAAFSPEKTDEPLLPEAEALIEENQIEASIEVEEKIESTEGAEMLLAGKVDLQDFAVYKGEVTKLLSQVLVALDNRQSSEEIIELVDKRVQAEVANTLRALKSKREALPVATVDDMVTGSPEVKEMKLNPSNVFKTVAQKIKA
jgi:ATP-dependent Clp endopeptidase proteolytic subunit ClpP